MSERALIDALETIAADRDRLATENEALKLEVRQLRVAWQDDQQRMVGIINDLRATLADWQSGEIRL